MKIGILRGIGNISDIYQQTIAGIMNNVFFQQCLESSYPWNHIESILLFKFTSLRVIL